MHLTILSVLSRIQLQALTSEAFSRSSVLTLQSPLDVAVAVPHNLLLAPFKVSIIARLGILIQALLHSSCSVHSLSSRSDFFESELEVLLSELVCIGESCVLVSVFGSDRVLIITTIVPELVVAAHIDILMSLVEDIGLSSKQKLSMVIYTRIFK